jgi:hypothetical protein
MSGYLRRPDPKRPHLMRIPGIYDNAGLLAAHLADALGVDEVLVTAYVADDELELVAVRAGSPVEFADFDADCTILEVAERHRDAGALAAALVALGRSA